VPSERCFEATILDYTTEIENIDFEAYPDKWADSEKADYFLKITNIKQVDRMKTLLKLTMYEQPDTSVEEFIEKFGGGQNPKWLLTEREIDLQEKEIQREFSKKIKEGGPDLKRKIKEALNNMDETDRPGNKNKSRNEQGLLRTNLFSDAEEFRCALCNQIRPVRIMVAGHIKPRNKCEKEERLDTNVVMPICKIGCDELYEKGYLLVDKDGLIIKNNSKPIPQDLDIFFKQYKGLKCTHFNDRTRNYFQFKYELMA